MMNGANESPGFPPYVTCAYCSSVAASMSLPVFRDEKWDEVRQRGWRCEWKIGGWNTILLDQRNDDKPVSAHHVPSQRPIEHVRSHAHALLGVWPAHTYSSDLSHISLAHRHPPDPDGM
jgi:hypothetical protein